MSVATILIICFIICFFHELRYVHDDIARYGFGTLNANNEWNGEPPLGTRGVHGFGGGYSDLDRECKLLYLFLASRSYPN